MMDEFDTQDFDHEDDDTRKVSIEKSRGDSVDLADTSLVVVISDALSERECIRFTILTKTTLPDFQKHEFSVVRQHEEFVWLHERYTENLDYAGLLIPPPPSKPNFDVSRDKLAKLGEDKSQLTEEEFSMLKAELEAEYLATFKKTVAMHEVFLQRLALHPKLRSDTTFQVFLEYDGNLMLRMKNTREKISGFFSYLKESVDDMLVSSQKDSDEYFQSEKEFTLNYFNRIREAVNKCDRMTKAHKDTANKYIRVSGGLHDLSEMEVDESSKNVYTIMSKSMDKARKLEGRVTTDQDLKLSDLLRYYMKDTNAAKNILLRRLKCLAAYESANKALEKARAKNKDIQAAEDAQQKAFETYENMSKLAKQELQDFDLRRVAAFKKNLVELGDLEVKHGNAQLTILKNCLSSIEAEPKVVCR